MFEPCTAARRHHRFGFDTTARADTRGSVKLSPFRLRCQANLSYRSASPHPCHPGFLVSPTIQLFAPLDSARTLRYPLIIKHVCAFTLYDPYTQFPCILTHHTSLARDFALSPQSVACRSGFPLAVAVGTVAIRAAAAFEAKCLSYRTASIINNRIKFSGVPLCEGCSAGIG